METVLQVNPAAGIEKLKTPMCALRNDGIVGRKTTALPAWLTYLAMGAVLALLAALPAIYLGVKYSRFSFCLKDFYDASTSSMTENVVEAYRWSMLSALVVVVFYGVLTVIAMAPTLIKLLECIIPKSILRPLKALVAEILSLRHYLAMFAASVVMYSAIEMTSFGVYPMVKAVAVPVAAALGNVGVLGVDVDGGAAATAQAAAQVAATAIQSNSFYAHLMKLPLSLLILSIALLIEKVVILKISQSFHRRYYSDRIERNNFALSVLEMLERRFPVKGLHSHDPISTPGDSSRRGSGDATASLTTRVFTRSVSPVASDRSTSPLSTDGSGKMFVSSGNNDNEDNLTSADYSSCAAKSLARSIYYGLRAPGKEELYMEDFKSLLEVEDAERFFNMLDENENGDVSRKELNDGIVIIFEEKVMLTRSLSINDQVIRKLDQFLLAFAILAAFWLSLPQYNISLTQSLTAVGASAFSVMFLFDRLAGIAFTSIVFILLTHPYDVGDSVSIDGEGFTIRDMGLWMTTLTSGSGRIAYDTNTKLSNKIIQNFRRSESMYEIITVSVPFQTTRDQLDQMMTSVNAFLAEQRRLFKGPTSYAGVKFDNSDSMTFTIYLRHRFSFHNAAEKADRTAIFLDNLHGSAKSAGIKILALKSSH